NVGTAGPTPGFGLVGRTAVWLVKASPQSVFPQNASGSGVVGADNQRKQASVTAEKRALTPRRKHASFFDSEGREQFVEAAERGLPDQCPGFRVMGTDNEIGNIH